MTTRCREVCQTLLWMAVVVFSGRGGGADDLQARLLFLAPEGPRLIAVRVSSGPRSVAETRRRYAEALFRFLDRDGDGKLDSEEAAQIPQDARLRAGGKTLGDRWRKLDVAPRDEAISPEELFQYIDEKMGPSLTLEREPPRQSQTVRLFEELDTDGDGRVSFDEIARGFEALKRYDFDDDETLSVAELQPFPLSVVQARRQSQAEEEPLPLLMLDGPGQIAEAADRCLSEYGTGGSISAENVPVFEPREFSRFDRNTDGAWNREELELYLRRSPPDLQLQVRLAPPSVSVAGSGGERGRPTVDMGGVPLEFRARSNSYQIADAIRLYKIRFRMADAGRKGYLTPAEFGTLQAENAPFESVDLNGDGEVTLSEIETFFSLQGLAGQSRLVIRFSDEAKTLFDILDADGDRRLTRREFLEAAGRLEPYDRTGDGALSRNELTSRFRITFTQPELLEIDPAGSMALPRQRQPLVRENLSGPLWFRRMDRNQDGEISWREFLGPREAFELLDQDADGLITLEEAERAERLRGGAP